MIIHISYLIIATCLMITCGATARWCIQYGKHMSTGVKVGAWKQSAGMALTASVLVSDVFVQGGYIHQWSSMVCAMFSVAMILDLDSRLARYAAHE